MGESQHLAAVREGQARSRGQQAERDAAFNSAQFLERGVDEAHNNAVQAERRAALPLAMQAIEAVTNSNVPDPRLRQAIQGGKEKALRNLGIGGERQPLVEAGAQAAGGILPVAGRIPPEALTTEGEHPWITYQRNQAAASGKPWPPEWGPARMARPGEVPF